MQEFKVEKHRTPVTLRLRGGPAMQGQAFLPELPADDPWVNKLYILMNGREPFIPIEVAEGRSVVLNKDRVIACRYDGPMGPVVEILAPRRRVTLVLEDGTMLTGDLVADGPPDRRRVLDCLNRPEPFLLLETRDGDYVVRRDAIECVPSDELGDPREEDADFAIEQALETMAG